jgi:signal transduction histidine kinase
MSNGQVVSGPTVSIHVCDNGSGILAELLERLFQPFVSRRAGGTGLGLAIVARIMEAHGGSVALDARPGWATCFTLTLPAETR